MMKENINADLSRAMILFLNNLNTWLVVLMVCLKEHLYLVTPP